MGINDGLSPDLELEDLTMRAYQLAKLAASLGLPTKMSPDFVSCIGLSQSLPRHAKLNSLLCVCDILHEVLYVPPAKR